MVGAAPVVPEALARRHLDGAVNPEAEAVPSRRGEGVVAQGGVAPGVGPEPRAGGGAAGAQQPRSDALAADRARHLRLRQAPQSDEVTLAVALFGTAVLIGSPWEALHSMRTAQGGDGSGGADGGCGGGGCGGCG